MTTTSHSTPPQNIRIIVQRFEVDWIKTQGEITHYKPTICTSLTKHRLAIGGPEDHE